MFRNTLKALFLLIAVLISACMHGRAYAGNKDILIDIDETILKKIILNKINAIDRSVITKSDDSILNIWALDAFFITCFRDDNALFDEYPRREQQLNAVIPNNLGV